MSLSHCKFASKHYLPFQPSPVVDVRFVHHARCAEHPRGRAELAVLARLDLVALEVDPVRRRRAASCSSSGLTILLLLFGLYRRQRLLRESLLCEFRLGQLGLRRRQA